MATQQTYTMYSPSEKYRIDTIQNATRSQQITI